MTDGFIVTNDEGGVFEIEGRIGVLNTAKEVQEALALAGEFCTPNVYALVPIPASLVAHYIEARAHHGLTRAGFLHDLALRFIGTLPWPDDSGADPEETAQSLADLDGEQDTWRE